MKNILTLALISCCVVSAQAATETVSLKSAESTTTADLDKEVSDAKMRADSGSKSRYSASLTFTYMGASMEKPFGDERPQIGRSDRTIPVSVGGGVGARYRLNKNESLYFSTGFRKAMYRSQRPGSTTDWEVSDPGLTYNNTFGTGDIQIGSSVAGSVSTEDDSKAVGNVGTLSYSVSALSQFADTGLRGGILAYTWYTHYRSGYEQYENGQLDYGLSFGPMVNYRFNDHFNVYTHIKAVTLTHWKSSEEFDMDDDDVIQSLGVGISPIRDVYLAPNVSFYWNQMRADKTTVNLSASINVF